MKHTFKISFLTFVTLVLLLFILFVDTTFYHVPSFIKIYRIEREVIVCISALIILFGIRSILQRRTVDLKKILYTGWCLIICLFVINLISQLALKKFMVLWDDNPFLAEFPMVWNSVSEFNAVLTTGILFTVLLLLKRILDYRPNRYSNFEFRFLVGLIVISSIMFNFLEDRYNFGQISLLQNGQSGTIWIIGSLIIVISLVISFYKSWNDVLNKREKYIGFFFSLGLIPVGLYLLFSNLLFPVFAFSTSIKGFVISTLLFVNVYAIASFIGLLLRLPTASIYDRVTNEILSISRVSQMISENASIEEISEAIVRNACTLTASDACWLTIEDENHGLSKIIASVHLSTQEKTLLDQPEARCLGDIIRITGDAFIIHNMNEDNRTLPIRLSGLDWKSLIAVPLMKDRKITGVLYSVKKASYAFDNKDLSTLRSYAIQTNIAMSSSPLMKKLNDNYPSSGANKNIGEFESNGLIVRYSEERHTIVDPLIINGNRNFIFRISWQDSQFDNIPEVKSILKTVFSLETDCEIAFIKAVKLLANDYPGLGLSTCVYSDKTQFLHAYSTKRFHFWGIGPSNDSILEASVSDNQTNDLDFFQNSIQLKPDSLLALTNSENVDLIQKNFEGIQEFAKLDISDIQKNIPETQQVPGTLILFKLNK